MYRYHCFKMLLFNIIILLQDFRLQIITNVVLASVYISRDSEVTIHSDSDFAVI